MSGYTDGGRAKRTQMDEQSATTGEVSRSCQTILMSVSPGDRIATKAYRPNPKTSVLAALIRLEQFLPRESLKTEMPVFVRLSPCSSILVLDKER